MLFQNLRLLNLCIILPEGGGALEVFDRGFVISGLIKRQGKIVVGLRGLGIGLLGF